MFLALTTRSPLAAPFKPTPCGCRTRFHLDSNAPYGSGLEGSHPWKLFPHDQRFPSARPKSAARRQKTIKPSPTHTPPTHTTHTHTNTYTHPITAPMLEQHNYNVQAHVVTSSCLSPFYCSHAGCPDMKAFQPIGVPSVPPGAVLQGFKRLKVVFFRGGNVPIPPATVHPTLHNFHF